MAVYPTNQLPANQLALHWLREAKEPHEPSILYLLQLAAWGIEKGIRFRGNRIEPEDLESQVHVLLGVRHNALEEQANIYRWLTTNPNGPEQEEQEGTLELALQAASDPMEAAGVVLETVSDRMAAQRPLEWD